jgi:hypothetical protein
MKKPSENHPRGAELNGEGQYDAARGMAGATFIHAGAGWIQAALPVDRSVEHGRGSPIVAMPMA